MKYTKPEVVLLGEATRVIESPSQKGSITKDSEVNQTFTSPAYDLDE